jgi:two-component system, sensor histidine kinase and response regulator
LRDQLTIGCTTSHRDQPQGLQRAREARGQIGRVAGRLVAGEVRHRLALDARDLVELARAEDDVLEQRRVDRLGDVAQRPVLERLDGGLEQRVGGHDDHRDIDVARAHRAQELDPGHPRHRDVAQDDVERRRLEDGRGLASVGGGRDVVPRLGEDALEGPEQGGFVVRDQHSSHARILCTDRWCRRSDAGSHHILRVKSMARILVVDDSAVNRKLLAACLAETGHELIEAESGERALELAHAQHPDLVLLDVMMPGIDGFETTRRLKAAAGDGFLPIVLITALNDHASRLTGIATGADDFLTKPFDRQELLARVKNLLALRAKDLALVERSLALVELNRFKDEMSALIVHDLKNPMAVILSTCDFLSRELGPGAADAIHREALEDARTAGRRVMRLLANLLDVSRIEASHLDLRRAPTDVGALLDDIAHQRRLLAQAKRIGLDVAAHGLVNVDADGDLLSRAVENMVDNSLRHTPRDGRVELAAEGSHELVRISVANTGKPIPVEARSLIFEKFGQASPLVGRTNLGMGLYFCRLATELHGGRIWVEETPAFATVFVMELPRISAAAGA